MIKLGSIIRVRGPGLISVPRCIILPVTGIGYQFRYGVVLCIVSGYEFR